MSGTRKISLDVTAEATLDNETGDVLVRVGIAAPNSEATSPILSARWPATMFQPAPADGMVLHYTVDDGQRAIHAALAPLADEPQSPPARFPSGRLTWRDGSDGLRDYIGEDGDLAVSDGDFLEVKLADGLWIPAIYRASDAGGVVLLALADGLVGAIRVSGARVRFPAGRVESEWWANRHKRRAAKLAGYDPPDLRVWTVGDALGLRRMEPAADARERLGFPPSTPARQEEALADAVDEAKK